MAAARNRIGRAEQDGALVFAMPRCELAAGGGLARAVHTDHEDDLGHKLLRRLGWLVLVENGLEFGLEQRLELGAAGDGFALSLFAQRGDNFAGRGHADVGRDERKFQLFERRFIDFAGECEDRVDVVGKRLAGARDRIFHAVEYALALGLVQAAKECLDHDLVLGLVYRRDGKALCGKAFRSPSISAMEIQDLYRFARIDP